MKRILLLLALALLTSTSCISNDKNPIGPGGSLGPSVTITSPLNGATNVSTGVAVTATFSTLMEPASLNASSFYLSAGGVRLPGVVTYSLSRATLTPTAPLAEGTLITAVVTTAARDLAGRPLVALTTWSFRTATAGVGQRSPVNLGSATGFAILAKTGVSTVGTTAIVGDVGLSPAAASALSGFALSAPPTTFTTSALVTGQVFASDYDPPTPANLTAAVLDMQTAYDDAAGRTLPDHTELAAGTLSGLTLAPGLYKWGTAVNIPTSITLSGSSNDVWIFQIAQNLTVGNGVQIVLAGGALPRNIFWQVAGQTTLGTTSNMKGTILCRTLIAMNTGSTLLGRALAQTAVTLDAAHITRP